MKPKINSAAATTRILPGRLHLEPSPTSKLVPGSRLPNAMPNSLPQLRRMEAFLGHRAYVLISDLVASILKPFC